MRSPQANALCERLLGTLRRECLDFLIPLTEDRLRRLLHEWVCHQLGEMLAATDSPECETLTAAVLAMRW